MEPQLLPQVVTLLLQNLIDALFEVRIKPARNSLYLTDRTQKLDICDGRLKSYCLVFGLILAV
ncbi:hypothetical protein D0T25_30100 [Duganella sp. BJB488]|nr:hypothetical protein D0T26_30260 [Duganella sp. BJB489]RFP12551.1 hypothetical protein D0T25_30100 [Duganella sp. BJB488]RFP29118.1 hypothetical protein D0T24_30790 [Duganella sp. BJB480]